MSETLASAVRPASRPTAPNELGGVCQSGLASSLPAASVGVRLTLGRMIVWTVLGRIWFTILHPGGLGWSA